MVCYKRWKELEERVEQIESKVFGGNEMPNETYQKISKQKRSVISSNYARELDKVIMTIISEGGGKKPTYEIVSMVKEKIPNVQDPAVRYAIWCLVDEGKIEFSRESDFVVKG